ncbi:MAG: two-component regulator propeller domain-containing protein [Bacteroidales bacterium]|nr:two-component regulator propeller domain-containing protein [Bacteroidales bacterium]
MRYVISLTLLFCSFSASVRSGDIVTDIPVGHWRHHLPNNRIIRVEESPGQIIGATPYGLIIFSKADNSVQKINKVHGMSDFDIAAVTYAPSGNALVIGYENGNIDIYKNKTFHNITDILQSSILGSKRINNITADGSMVLLACDFGIVRMSLTDMLIYDTWYIGPFGSMVRVNDIVITGDMIYAATHAGLMAADLNAPNLADYRNWQRVEVSGEEHEVFNRLALHAGRVVASLQHEEGDVVYYLEDQQWSILPLPGEPPRQIRQLRSSRNRLIVAHNNRIDIFDTGMSLVESVQNYYSGTVTALDALYDTDEMLWIGDARHGLIRQHGPQHYENIILQGPPYSNAFGLASAGGRIWVAPGAVSYGGLNSWNQNGFFLFEEGRWKSFNRLQFPLLQNVADIIRITVDPRNHNRAYAASWYGGMLELSPEGVVELYNEENSTLSKRTQFDDRLRVGGVAVDTEGNVWVTNSEVDKPLSVMKAGGEWMAFTSDGLFGAETRVGDIIIDKSGQKWINLPGSGLYIFRENILSHPGDFSVRRLTTQVNNGGLPNNNVHSMAVDHNGYVWLGTEEGVAVFFSPHQILNGDAVNAHRIIVEQEDGFAGYLLETETVSCIEVDGANKKWFGTSRSGAFLLSSDGRQTIMHFNKKNSPLPSNNILDITVNEQNGEVFFATDRGLVSFRGFATGATNRHTDVYAYPNPVRPGYAGYISVKGLVRNANVKITDINGNLVWETIAEGGQAVWNGQDLFGRRPASGVYLVFSTNDDGEETMVTKILFIQ